MVGVINGLSQTIIQKIELWVQGQPYYTYRYNFYFLNIRRTQERAFFLLFFSQFGYMYQILGLLQIPAGYKDNLGYVTGWIPDNDNGDPQTEKGFIANTGLGKRLVISKKSDEFWMINKLSLPLFAQNKLIPLNTDFQLFIYFNSADFCLMKGKGLTKKYMIKVLESEINLTKIELQDRWLTEYKNYISRAPLFYDFTDYALAQFVIPADTLMKNLAQTSLTSPPKR